MAQYKHTKSALRFCAEQNEILGYDALQSAVGEPRIQFAIVRHPIDRFLSGFVDKCIREAKVEKTRCFECNSNISCFVDNLYNLLMKTVEENLTTYNYELAHFAPQTWYCDFKDHFGDYIILHRGEGTIGVLKLAQELESIFKSARIPDSLRKEILNELLGKYNNRY
ncbi:unnamed protein product [Strongylus vulgaris]|uniref:Sulfotransferase domain-containing protein n=1 Tax=Strongylus vulgaris TaxID=40348 RepID=A0A3P7IG67_STRVU|nr:unnamed protein product [Strongylus vulgaris]